MSAENLSPRRRRRRFLIGFDEEELTVKREPEEDIKDYAETTMNELLGWYGYDKVNSRDTQGLNLTHFASNSEENHNKNASISVTPPSSGAEGSDVSGDGIGSENAIGDGLPSLVRSDSASPGPDVSSTASDEVARQQQQMVSALSSVTKHPGAPDSPNLPPGCIICAWCQKVGMKLFTLKTPTGCKAFCSELCFTQCRRASFKKNKICDWCKHVRHTVNYVDFQDGEQQLQFCSDKCLNQYKMNIFCKETQAHLQMHTHLKEAACKIKAPGSINLITPELWLRDCKINGMPSSPMGSIDNMDDMNSDDNMSSMPSPTPVQQLSRPNSPVMKEKREEVPEAPPLIKEKEKSSKKLSLKIAHRKSVRESKSPLSSKHYRDRKINGNHFSDAPNVTRQSPIQASPSSHSSHSRNGHLTNGGSTPSLLSPPPPPPYGFPRPPHHTVPIPQRHGPPPVPSPLGMGGIDSIRQPFFHHNMMPPPFQFFAQQQMENFLRSQRGMDVRSKAPPHLPIPPWAIPQFPHLQPPPLQPPVQPRSPTLPHTSPTSRTFYQIPSHKSSHHHGKHKRSRRISGHSINGSQQATLNHPPIQEPSGQFQTPLLPPMTVMVPFPLPLPIPIPIPVPILIPPDVMEKFKKKQKDTKNKHESPPSDAKKRKSSFESTKSKKIRKESASDISFPNPPTKTEIRNASSDQNDPYYERLENFPKITEPESSGPPKGLKTPNENSESRSYSPPSGVISSNDESEEYKKTFKHRERDDYSPINFSTCNLPLGKSSPITSLVINDFSVPMSNNLDKYESPSPTDLTVRDKGHNSVGASAMNFKKKHLREQLSLIT